MKKLSTNFQRFCFRNRNKGIPNLMLYIALGSAMVYIMSMLDNSNTLYNVLRFDRSLILQGQVWRLFTYVFTYNAGHLLLTAISLFCFYSLGRAIENTWGTFRFNLFYLSGVLLMDAFAMGLGWIPATVTIDGLAMQVPIAGTTVEYAVYGNMVYYLNLSMLIAYATMYPDAHFLLFYIIPVKAWIFGVLDLVLTLYSVFELTFLTSNISIFPHNLFPLVAIGNYFLMFGKDVVNLIPLSWRMKGKRHKKQKTTVAADKPPIQFRTAKVQQTSPSKENYTHRCTVCGRTDVSNPELEFRYCSRCSGYHCYCEDHISNHEHVE